MKYGYLILILVISLVTSLRVEKIEEVASLNTQLLRKKSKMNSTKSQYNVMYLPHPNVTDRLSNSTYRDLNNSLVKQHIKDFKETNHKWDFKLFDRQLEEIATIMTYKDQNYQTIDSKRAFLQQFLVPYDNCDKNKDNSLDKAEFNECMKNDPYFSEIKPTQKKFAFYSNYSSDGEHGFYEFLFNNADSFGKNSTTFYDD